MSQLSFVSWFGKFYGDELHTIHRAFVSAPAFDWTSLRMDPLPWTLRRHHTGLVCDRGPGPESRAAFDQVPVGSFSFDQKGFGFSNFRLPKRKPHSKRRPILCFQLWPRLQTTNMRCYAPDEHGDQYVCPGLCDHRQDVCEWSHAADAPDGRWSEDGGDTSPRLSESKGGYLFRLSALEN